MNVLKTSICFLMSCGVNKDRQGNDEIAELRQAVILMGDQLELLREQMKFKCDWNFTSYCIMPLRFKDSKYDW